jgi:hypothetical protein
VTWCRIQRLCSYSWRKLTTRPPLNGGYTDWILKLTPSRLPQVWDALSKRLVYVNRLWDRGTAVAFHPSGAVVAVSDGLSSSCSSSMTISIITSIIVILVIIIIMVPLLWPWPSIRAARWSR